MGLWLPWRVGWGCVGRLEWYETKGRTSFGSVALNSADLAMTKIWSGRWSWVVVRVGCYISSSRWAWGRGVGGVLRIVGAPRFVGFVCGVGGGWEGVLLGCDKLKRNFEV